MHKLTACKPRHGALWDGSQGLASPEPHSVLLCFPISCSDDEKSRQMWRRYQEREDSRISGEQGCEKRRAGLGWE